ncbi:M48 family metallopeptidase [Peribacillus alkalitolerans]|uniref:M48 family metallopeptidase n=1 Tax=Peribacillus alkalitolerans TaxID=1550385 RepID=UPI0013D2FE96|nr:M48 family metallopeptidase [Peribacillus alkalitolerans]
MRNDRLKNTLVHEKENIYFALAALFSIVTYIFLAVSIIGIVIIAVLFLFSYFVHALNLAYIRRNGVRVSENQFSHIYERANVLSQEMGLDKTPFIYVMESSGILNAFATRFFGKNMVVLYSDLFDLIEDEGEEEVLFVLAHELAHLKRKHVLTHMLLLPAMWVPFLSEAYLRACEYTCDRYAAFYTNNLESSLNALAIFAIGERLFKKVDKEAYIRQLQEERGFFAWLSEKLSTHPHLPKRMNALNVWAGVGEQPLFKEKKSHMFMAFVVYVSFTLGLSGIIYFGIDKIEGVLDGYFGGEYEVEGTTPLMEAAGENDVDLVAKLLKEDASQIDATDSDGSTALHWAVYSESYEATKLLLESGADPNIADIWETTPLISATYNENVEMVKLLLNHGADKTMKDEGDMTAYDVAEDVMNKELMKLLK